MDLFLGKISLVVIALLLGCEFYPSCAEELVQPALGSEQVLNVWTKPGKRFEFMLADLLPRSVEGNIKVFEEQKDSLPSWMSMVNRRIIGVPTKADIGSYVLSIVHTGSKHHVLHKQLKISVGGGQVESQLNVMRLNSTKPQYTPIECMPNAPLTVATVIVDLSIGKLSGQQRVQLLEDVAGLAGVHVDAVALVPGKGASTALGLNDVVILTAGPGDVREVQEQGVAVSWQIGCGTDISGMRTVGTLKSGSETGSFRQDLSVPVIGWHITAGMKTRSVRIRREVAGVFNTPGGAGLPTRSMGTTVRLGHATVLVGITATPSPSVTLMTDTMMPTVTILATPTITSVAPVIPMRPTSTIAPSSSVAVILTETPTTEAPEVTTEKPTTEEPTPEKPTTEESTTEKPTTEKTTEEVTTEESTETPSTESTTETPSTEETTTMELTTPATIPTKPTAKQHPPALYNAIDRIDVFENQAFRFFVPHDTFHDREDGDTTKLKLRMFTIDGDKLARTSWVQFDNKRQLIYGLPLTPRQAPYEFLMVATDKSGMKARDAFEIYVMEEDLQVGIEFTMTLDNDYDAFNSDVAKRIKLMDAISGIFSTGNFTVKFTDVRLLGYRPGSVIVKWAFATVPYDPCDQELVNYVLGKLLDGDEPSEEFLDALVDYGYNVEQLSYVLRGPCAPTEVPPIEARLGDSPSHSWWVGHIIPGVVLAALLLIIGLVVLIFIGCRRKAKLTGEDKKTFIEKKKPIVFVEEFEEKEPFIKQPIIIPNEKPPLPPPAYPRSSTPTTSQPPTPLLGTDGDEKRSPPYQPPSFASGRESASGRQPQPSYRLPPPYVAP